MIQRLLSVLSSLALLLIGLVGYADAHPGHGTQPPTSPAHYVLEMPHALVAIAIAVATIYSIYKLAGTLRAPSA